MHDLAQAWETMDLRQLALTALQASEPAQKLQAMAHLQSCLQSGVTPLAADKPLSVMSMPGMPERLALVEPHRVPRRKLGSPVGRAALLHALAHIEYNAINLALDAVVRFARLPTEYYHDWLRIGLEEAYHFQLLSTRLADMSHTYGDFSAHNGLWEMALKTADDPLARMGLVPRLLEARGLDVTPGLRTRLEQAGDSESAAILDIILRDEIGHVRTGNKWYYWLCLQRNLDPEHHFTDLLRHYAVSAPHPPFNDCARLASGFTAAELASWTALHQSQQGDPSP